MNILYFGGAVVFTLIAYILMRYKKRSKRLQKLRREWGKIPGKQLDLDSVAIFFRLNQSVLSENSYIIDDDTWCDLDLNNIYSLLNRTATPVGAQYLFYMLRHPQLNESPLEQREMLIDNFMNNNKLREDVQLALQRVSERDVRYLPYSLWGSLPEKPSYAPFVTFMSFVAVCVLALVLLNYIHVSALVVVFIVNLIIRTIVKKKIDIFIFSFQYLAPLINTAEDIASLKHDALKTVNADLAESLKGCKKIAKKIYSLQFKDEMGLLDFFNSYLLWDVSGFYSAIDNIKHSIKDLREIFETVGSLDALISAASYRREYDNYCRPQFSENGYAVENIYNPLVNDAVANSLLFDRKNIMITGSNMAGKTTFLKTMGVNAVFAQTLYMCMAEEYKAPFLKVISSIVRQDNLAEGKSYYLAEVESVLRILKASETEIVHLFILDEIFRGTNSEERFAASYETLDYLANGKDYCLVATHDLRLSSALDGVYKNFHFQESVSDSGLVFDYKLHPGIATTRNAIALLDFVGYPKKIVEGARKLIKNEKNA